MDTVAIRGEIEVAVLGSRGQVVELMHTHNVLTRRALDWFVKFGMGWHATNVNLGVGALWADPMVQTNASGTVQVSGYNGATQTSGFVAAMQAGTVRSFKPVDQSQGTGTAGQVLLNPFNHIAVSTSTAVQVATADQIPGTILKTVPKNDAGLAASPFQEVDKVGVQWTRSFGVNECAGVIGGLGWCNHTNGQGMGSYGVLPATIAGTTTAWTMTYRVYANW